MPPAGKKPPQPARGGFGRGGGRKIGQVLVDLGYIDQEQVWDIVEEAKNTDQRTGQVAVGRGLISEDQLLQALAEQHGLKVVNLADVKPHPEVLSLVPETMATVYNILPLTMEDKVLTVAMGDPGNLAAIDDLKNLLGITEVKPVIASSRSVAEAVRKYYAGKEESIFELSSNWKPIRTWGRRARNRPSTWKT